MLDVDDLNLENRIIKILLIKLIKQKINLFRKHK